MFSLFWLHDFTRLFRLRFLDKATTDRVALLLVSLQPVYSLTEDSKGKFLEEIAE